MGVRQSKRTLQLASNLWRARCRILARNVVLKARRILILRCAHPTYHYGDDRRLDLADFRGYILTTISGRRRR